MCIVIFMHHTCLAPLYLALELSLLWGPVRNKNLPSRGPKCTSHLPHSASLAQCKQENTLDIALDTLPSQVFKFQGKDCVTQPLQILEISRDPQTHVQDDVISTAELSRIKTHGKVTQGLSSVTMPS